MSGVGDLFSLSTPAVLMPPPPSVARELRQAQTVDRRAEQARRVALQHLAQEQRQERDQYAMHSDAATEAAATDVVERKSAARERRRHSNIKELQVEGFCSY